MSSAVYVPGYGPRNPKLIIIGESPKKAVPKEFIDALKMNVIYSNHPTYTENCVSFF